MAAEGDTRSTVNTPKYSQHALHPPGYSAGEKLESVKRGVLSLVVEMSAFFFFLRKEHHKKSNHLWKLYAKFWNLFLTKTFGKAYDKEVSNAKASWFTDHLSL